MKLLIWLIVFPLRLTALVAAIIIALILYSVWTRPARELEQQVREREAQGLESYIDIRTGELNQCD